MVKVIEEDDTTRKAFYKNATRFKKGGNAKSIHVIAQFIL